MTSEQYESLKRDLELVQARLEILKKNTEALYEILDQILWLGKQRAGAQTPKIHMPGSKPT